MKFFLSLFLISINLLINIRHYLCLQLIWREEFNGRSLNRNIWRPQNTCNVYNYGLQCYTNRPQNVRVRNGRLIVQARVERYGNKRYTSAKVEIPENRLAFRYGLYMIRAKLPKGKHLWPAIWMLPSSNAYGRDGLSGEIDILESRGQHNHILDAAIHVGNNTKHGKILSFGKEIVFPGKDFSSRFHTFGFYWDRNVMKWYCDNKLYHSQAINRNFYTGHGKNPYSRNGQPFDKGFRFIINIAIGGTYFQHFNDPLNEREARNWPNPTLEIDYIRVYRIDR